jgi:localization factor PodJL
MSAPRLARKPLAEPVPAPDGGPAAVKRTGVMTPELEEILKGLTQDPSGSGGTLGRLERRIAVLERAMAERAEPKASASVLVEESLSRMGQHLGELEQRIEENAKHWRSAYREMSARIRFIEIGGVLTAADVTVPDPVDEPTPETRAETPAETSKRDLEPLLAAARRAALEAAQASSEGRDGDASGAASLLRRSGLSSLMRALSGRRGLIAAGIAPLPLLAFAVGAMEHQAPSEMPLPVLAEPAQVPDPLAMLMALAQSGDPKAEVLLGFRAIKGEEGKADDKAAAVWFRRAAEHGDAVAQNWLGSLYRTGKGVEASAEESVRWYAEAAAAGNRSAMNNLAVAYAQGWGMERDLAASAHWFEEAARRGFATAQFNLAVLYERGDGVTRDPAKAYEWYAIAARGGDAEAQARCNALAADLSPDALLAAKEAADAFTPEALDPIANSVPKLSDVIGG